MAQVAIASAIDKCRVAAATRAEERLAALAGAERRLAPIEPGAPQAWAVLEAVLTAAAVGAGAVDAGAVGDAGDLSGMRIPDHKWSTRKADEVNKIEI